MVADKIEASGNSGVAEARLSNNDKNMWYLSINPLPEIIKGNKEAQADIATCAANTVLMSKPLFSLLPPPVEDDY